MAENPRFLDKKYQDLAGSREVSRAVSVSKKEKGESPHTRDERIEAYLERLERYFGHKEGDEYVEGDERGFELLKNKILERYITKAKEIPESYYENIIRDSGRLGDWQHMDEAQKETFRIQNSEAVLSDQRASLEEWIDYMALKDSAYIPSELKYFIIRNIVRMSEYDKDKKIFGKRSVGTVKKFPDLNHEALGYLVDGIIKKWQGEEKEFEHDIQPEDREKFRQFVNKEDFQKLYAWCYENFKPISEHLLPVTDGLWVRYAQNSNPQKLVESVRGKGTGWCTAGEQTAKTQLQAGDFYVYYTKDDNGQYTIPRIAIRREGESIAEVRGIAYKQNLDPYMGEVLDKKLDEFPDKEKYIKKEKDNRELMKIDKKIKRGENLTKEELVFLYEIDSKIDSFGYNADPRIVELRKPRNVEEDMLTIFECTKDEIAHNASEVNENTKVYVGEWNIDVFQKVKNFPQIKHLYEKFPEEKIFMMDIETDPSIQSAEDVKNRIIQRGMWCSGRADYLLTKTKFSKQAEKYSLVRFTAKELGLTNAPLTYEIYKKAEESGLELCPAELGPQLRLQYEGSERMWIAMNQIVSRSGVPLTFYLSSNGARLELDEMQPSRDRGWISDRKFVFRFRRTTHQS